MAKISNELLKAAQNAQVKYGIPTAFTLAIAGAETSFGTKGVADDGQNNVFGMKNSSGSFKSYSSISESVEDFARQISGAKGTSLSKAYAKDVKKAKSIGDFADALLKHGWTSDKGYKELVTGVYNDLAKDKDLINSIGSIEAVKDNQESNIDGKSEVVADDLKWWGDFLVVLLCILVVIGGVVFVAMAIKDSTGFSLKKGVEKLANK